MKKKLIILFLTSIFFLKCEKKEISATIKIKIELENKLSKEYPDLNFLKIYKNGKLFKEIKPDGLPFIQHSIKLKNLEEGKYEFEYLNIFEQKIVRELIIQESKIYEISLNPDYSDYKQNFKKSLIRKLKVNDSLKITYRSQGCFNREEDSVIIYKKEKFYELERNGKTTKLTDKEVNNLIKMECELNNIKFGGCTTSDIYIFSGKNFKKDFIDNTCKWNGWQNLKGEMKWK
ncbi:hypothetical protein ACEN2I_19235 [Flavobacterium sp. W22_SRS_FK3]|uniref:hypothetical protein n=1 Tax=Flavobacterium sp. W22_SRS_FK3 TaxID=3240275 RepID=UPI003F8FC577